MNYFSNIMVNENDADLDKLIQDLYGSSIKEGDQLFSFKDKTCFCANKILRIHVYGDHRFVILVFYDSNTISDGLSVFLNTFENVCDKEESTCISFKRITKDNYFNFNVQKATKDYLLYLNVANNNVCIKKNSYELNYLLDCYPTVLKVLDIEEIKHQIYG